MDNETRKILTEVLNLCNRVMFNFFSREQLGKLSDRPYLKTRVCGIEHTSMNPGYKGSGSSMPNFTNTYYFGIAEHAVGGGGSGGAIHRGGSGGGGSINTLADVDKLAGFGKTD